MHISGCFARVTQVPDVMGLNEFVEASNTQMQHGNMRAC
jgi:hypothetical protein